MYLSGTVTAALLLLLGGPHVHGLPVEQQQQQQTQAQDPLSSLQLQTPPDLSTHEIPSPPLLLPFPLQSETFGHIPPSHANPQQMQEPEEEQEQEEQETEEQEEQQEPTSLHRPSRYESTVLGRRLLALSKTGILSTIFPDPITSPRIPSSVAHTPIGLPEYIASCEEGTGNPTVLSLTISTSTLNANAGSNVSLTLSWWDEYIHLTHQQPWSRANLPRLNLVGYLEEISHDDVERTGIAACFTKVHGDSVLWLPGEKWAAHQGVWTRIVVQQVYWIGGFGDRNYIGWFDVDEWRAVAKEEWDAVRLPGEK